MKSGPVTALLLAAVMLTGCGSPQTAEDSAAEQAVTTTRSDLWSYGGSYYDEDMTDADAQAWIKKIRSHPNHPDDGQQVYQNAYGFAKWCGDHSENYALCLTEEYGWCFWDMEKYWEAPEDFRLEACRDLYQRVSAHHVLRKHDFTSDDITLSIKDIPEGAVWLGMLYTTGQEIWNAESYALTDSSGTEYKMIILPDECVSDEEPESLTAAIVDPALPAGEYTVTVNGVSTTFSVVRAEDYINHIKEILG